MKSGSRLDDVAVLNDGADRAVYRNELGLEVAQRWLDAVPGWFGTTREPVPEFPSKVALCLAREGELELVVKRSRDSRLRGQLAALGLARGRAEHSFELGLALERAQVPTPRVLAHLQAGEHRYLVAERVTAGKLWPTGTQADIWPARIRAVAHTLARLHDARLRHRDLKGSNIYVEVVSGHERIGLLDLDSAAQLRRPAGSRVMRRDLGRLAASFQAPAAVAAGVTLDDWTQLVNEYVARRSRPLDESRLLSETLAWATNKLRDTERRGRAFT